MTALKWGGAAIGLVGLVCIVLGIWWWVNSRDTEVVLPARDVVGEWELSPGGDKIVYRPEEDVVILFPANNHTYRINTYCSGFDWLDNNTLQCGKFIIDTVNFVEAPMEIVKVTDVDLKRLLMGAEKIYWRDGSPQALVIVNRNYPSQPGKNYLVTDIENIEGILQNIVYTTVGLFHQKYPSGEKYYSPNGVYYFIEEGGIGIAIYDAKTDEKLSHTPESTLLHLIGGWAADSSGIYYQRRPGLAPSRHPLEKIKVP